MTRRWTAASGSRPSLAKIRWVCFSTAPLVTTSSSAIRGELAKLYDQKLADGVRVLYGGSVKSGNVASIMAGADVDGALVGGASLQAEEFASICRYQQHLTA